MKSPGPCASSASKRRSSSRLEQGVDDALDQAADLADLVVGRGLAGWDEHRAVQAADGPVNTEAPALLEHQVVIVRENSDPVGVVGAASDFVVDDAGDDVFVDFVPIPGRASEPARRIQCSRSAAHRPRRPGRSDLPPRWRPRRRIACRHRAPQAAADCFQQRRTT